MAKARSDLAQEISTIEVVDFFCGCGGTSAGLKAAGMKILGGLDLDAGAAATYRANFDGVAFFDKDIRHVAPAEVADGIKRTEGASLLLSACAPCQPYTSFHRKSSTRKEERTLLLRLLPFVDHLRPDYIFVENVPGFHKVKCASTFNRFVAGLKRRGFHVDWEIVDCRGYGVPQRRRRLVLLASSRGEIQVPLPTHGTGPGLAPFTTVRDGLSTFRRCWKVPPTRTFRITRRPS